MKIALMCGFLVAMMMCQSSIKDSNRAVDAQTIPDGNLERPAIPKNNNWVPLSIEACLEKVNSADPSVEVDQSVNPFYLRLDVDGDNSLEIAVWVRDPTHKETALVLCRDVEPPFDSIQANLLGKFMRSENALNEVKFYVEAGWEIASTVETNEAIVSRSPGPKAAGESIALVYEGTEPSYIYWDRNRFQILED